MNESNTDVKSHCLSQIEVERNAYIKRHYEQLQMAIGGDYWDEETQSNKILGFDGENQIIKEPYEIDIETLYELSNLRRCLERFNTYSFIPFYAMSPRDRQRLKTLTDVWKKLMKAEALDHKELEQLLIRQES